jgi:hypothetical protein
MTTTQPLPPPERGDTGLSFPLANHSYSFTPTVSTLWVPLEATIGQWADFGHEAITATALVATGTAFYALSWETSALRHYILACQERECGHERSVARWLERAMQDLDCAIDQWYQVLSWLHQAGHDEQQDPTSLDTIQSLKSEVDEHQARRRALHRQVQQELVTIRHQQHAQGKEQAADAHSADAHPSC